MKVFLPLNLKHSIQYNFTVEVHNFSIATVVFTVYSLFVTYQSSLVAR